MSNKFLEPISSAQYLDIEVCLFSLEISDPKFMYYKENGFNLYNYSDEKSEFGEETNEFIKNFERNFLGYLKSKKHFKEITLCKNKNSKNKLFLKIDKFNEEHLFLIHPFLSMFMAGIPLIFTKFYSEISFKISLRENNQEIATSSYLDKIEFMGFRGLLKNAFRVKGNINSDSTYVQQTDFIFDNVIENLVKDIQRSGKGRIKNW